MSSSATAKSIRAEAPIAALAAQAARVARRGAASGGVLSLLMVLSDRSIPLKAALLGTFVLALLGSSVALWLWVMGWPKRWSSDFVPVPHRRAAHLAATAVGASLGLALGSLSGRYGAKELYGLLLGSACGVGMSAWRAVAWFRVRYDSPMLVDRGVASVGSNDRIALACFAEAIRLDPSHARAYYERAAFLLPASWERPAWAFEGTGRPSAGDFAAAAISDLDGAIGLQPGFAVAYALRAQGRLECLTHDSPEDERDIALSLAVADLGEAIRLDPASAPYRKSRGDLRPRGSDEELDDYDEAVRLDPTNAEFRTSRGRSYLDRGDLDRAIADFTEALRIKPGDFSALRWRSDAYKAKGDYGRHEADEAEIRRSMRP
jgi:tetratricopeptide (TPR) repeat protein